MPPRGPSCEHRWSEGTAARLAELLATDPPAPALAARMLECDPHFALSIAREMLRQRHEPPRTLGEAALFVAEAAAVQARRWLERQWATAQDDNSRSSAGELVARAIAVAHAARQIAGQSEVDSEEAFWAGMLEAAVGEGLPDDFAEEEEAEETITLIEEAHRGLASPDTRQFDACRAAGELARREWLRPWPGAWELARSIAAQAERLAALERRFAHELEQAKLASLAQFAYGAGHEINNPLANISLRAELLARGEEDESRRQKLQTIHAQAMRAHEMLADLMLFAKPPAAEMRECDLVELVAHVAADVAPRAAAQETELALVADAPAIRLAADATQLAVALKALVINALEAIERGGTIEIACQEHALHSLDGRPGSVLLVRDTGPGIAPETRPHIFDPFFSGREAGRGLGFGLCKCWRIVQLHAGEITVESHAGQGTTFRLWLPSGARSNDHPAQREHAGEFRPQPPAERAPLRATD